MILLIEFLVLCYFFGLGNAILIMVVLYAISIVALYKWG